MKNKPLSNKKELVIVGLGASAGGLEALTLFLSNLPPQHDNIAYVVVQHLSPTHKSMMRDLLARETTFDVLEIQSGLIPKANTVYITPPDRDVTLQNGLLHLNKPLDRWIGPKPSVDKFFISLASEKKENAVGVILSGTGSDGSQGVRAIRAEGGIAIAQDPKQAKYDGMPASAIQTKSVDYVLKAEEIANEIIHLLRYPNSLRVEKAEEDEFNAIFSILKEHINIDFSQYKKSTITRRIERRMAAIKATTIKDYISYLKDTRDEVELLYKDMLIGVTSFFRDAEAFEELKEQLKKYVQEHKEDEQFRIWISACSTGEEAYSIAIILDEILNFDRSKHIKIFATDIDEDAVKQARAGVFPEVTVANISPERLKRYFIQKGNEFEVKPQLKERVIFSRHDITMDPPFVNIDLVTCRNMLIYFETELQKKIFTTFAYALKHHGLLFLGKSESVGVHTDLFATIDPKSKIFQARTTTESRKLLYPQMLHSGKYIKPTTAVQTKKRVSTIEESIKNTLFEYYEDKCVVIDNDFNVHYIKGNMNDILKFPSGEMHNNILKMLPEKISLEVRSLIYKANKGDANITFPRVTEQVVNQELITIKLTPLEGYAGKYLFFLLCFENAPVKEETIVKKPMESENAYLLQLEQDLIATREHLQTVVEELETSNEELQSSNEELQASNEELQASNEELETTNEELQSTNEELQTAYSEIRALYEKQNLQKNYLQDKTVELSRLKEELDAQYKFTKEVLDTENNIVIVSDKEKILSVNKQFCKFFSQFETFEIFQKQHSCISDFFEKNTQEDYLYDDKEGMHWLDKLLISDRHDMKVEIKKEGETHTFHIMASGLNTDEQTYVITLTDITPLVLSRQQLRHDLNEEIKHNLSSSKIIHQFNTIFGNDVFMKQVCEEMKKPLNKIYQNYSAVIENAGFDEKTNFKYLTLFREEKDEILSNIELVKLFFGNNSSKTVNLYAIFEKISHFLEHDYNSKIKMQIFGKQNIEIEYKSAHIPQMVMLLSTLFNSVAQEAGLKNILLKVMLQESGGVITIGFSGGESLCQELLKFQSNQEIYSGQGKIVNDTFNILNTLLNELFHADIKITMDSCEIAIPKRYLD